MEGLRLDIRYVLRSLRSAPLYATVVVVTLALGIGANTAVFSVLRGVLLEPLPHANGTRVVRLYQPSRDAPTTGLSPLEMADYREAASLEDVVEYHSMPFTFIGADEPQRLQTGVVSAHYFDVLGVHALHGRTFRAGEDQPGSDPVLLLAWEYWQRAFGGDPGVIGRTFRMNDRTHTVVGVLPRVPQYPDANDVYMPISSCPFRAAPGWSENRTARQPSFGLLRRDASLATALSDLQVVATRLHATYPESYPADRPLSVAAVPLAELMTGDARPTILMLLGATSFLLLIVCANVVNLAIVRLMRREAELATRLALGASGIQIGRLVLLESAALAAAGALCGVLVAHLALGSLVPAVARFTPRAHEIRLDVTVMAFTALVAALAGLLGGLVPAWSRLRRAPGRADLRNTASARQSRLRGGLIVAQVALSLVLLIGAALMARSLWNLQRVDAGFDPARVLTARLDLNWTRYENVAQTTSFFRALEQRLDAVPEVAGVAFASSFPLNGDPAAQIEVRTDSDEPGADAIRIGLNSVSNDYFDVLGIPVLRGRALQDADGEPDGPLAAVVTRASARRLFGDADPVGRRVSADGGQTWGTIVGVVGDVRQELEGEFEAMLFVHRYRLRAIGSRLLVRGHIGAAGLERIVRGAIAEIDREQPITDVGTIEQFRAAALVPRRVTATLLVGFAALALVISAVGLGGIVAFSVADREKEIGIRLALGAPAAGVLGMVLRQALLLTAAGLVLGMLLALLSTRLLAGLLFGIPPTDATTFAVVALAFLSVAGAAGALPARRAVRIDPSRALRA